MKGSLLLRFVSFLFPFRCDFLRVSLFCWVFLCFVASAIFAFCCVFSFFVAFRCALFCSVAFCSVGLRFGVFCSVLMRFVVLCCCRGH